MKKFFLLPALLLVCFFVTGCFGLIVAHPREKCVTQFCLGSRGTLTNGPASTPWTEAEVLAFWGQPDKLMTNSEAQTVWHYQGQRLWSGVMPAYLIGLPIPIPTGHNEVDIYFKEGVALSARTRALVITGIMIGIAPPTVLAWEKEVSGDQGGTFVGSGFGEK